MARLSLLILFVLSVCICQGEAVFTYQNPFSAPAAPVAEITPPVSYEPPGLVAPMSVTESKPVVPTQMISIEAHVLEIAQSAVSDGGLDWLLQDNEFDARLRFFESHGTANLLAKPTVAVLDGETATIRIGDKVPYAVPASNLSERWTVQYLNTGVTLKISAQVQTKDLLKLKIHAEVSNIGQWLTNQAGSFPVISTRESESVVCVPAGEPVIIGGLLGDSVRKNRAGLPILMDIPILGAWFQYNSKEVTKTDIVFIILPELR
jgi:type II secretory pathway component GspD/PulD (secretin)